MNCKEMFGEAKWIAAGKYSNGPSKKDANGLPHFPVIRKKFIYSGGKAEIRIAGLGYFHFYINGKKVGDDLFLPLATDYEERNNYPSGEKLHGHRLYVPRYDITDYLKTGENLLAVHYGGGWYSFEYHSYFGQPKAIFLITVDNNGEKNHVFSSEGDLIADSFVESYYFTRFENQNYLNADESVFGLDFDESECIKAVEAEPLKTEYLFSDCPSDKVIEKIAPKKIGENEKGIIYDCGKNLTGYPELLIKAKKGEKVELFFSEELDSTGNLSERHSHGQSFSVINDGTERKVSPEFIWYGFRYFLLSGNAEPLFVDFCHSDVKVNSEFKSDNDLLNWLYSAYIHTQLCNMHGGIPSDCPHIERRGYTGDGQLCTHTAMDMLDCRKFYKKWIDDVSDCQDDLTGHVQYTAPYVQSGGGPGGWGSAIVEVPYQYYLHYADAEPLKKLYPQMLRYFDYLDAHSENGLVTSDKKGEWCLGDWCTPSPVALPAAFVNNYFYVKAMMRLCEIAVLIGKESDVPSFEQKIYDRKKAIVAAYYNTWDHNFIGSIQGANAFALDIGLGDNRTYENMVNYYRKLGRFDTGIFGTVILCRVLFERGDGDLALSLLLSEDTFSFAEMKKRGATTIWEYWPDATRDRSHSHPMFGAVSSVLFDYIAGIRELQPGGRKIRISPFVSRFDRIHASRETFSGKVVFDYERKNGSVDFNLTVPENVEAEFEYDSNIYVLVPGLNHFRFEEQ